MMTFETPSYLILLALLPTGVFLRHVWRKRGGLVTFSFAVWGETYEPMPKRSGRMAAFLSGLLLWAGIGALIVALAGPGLMKKERVFLNRGIDIMLVLDESPSMAARDFQPENRFESAKEVIRRFVRGRENDAIGIVSFSKEAALRMPPTIDHSAVLERLDMLRMMDLGNGTAIGMGLAVAALHLRDSTADTKVIVLITDGENNAGEITPTAAAGITAELGIRIYAIGIGSEGEVPFELANPETGKVYRGTYRGDFDEELLQEISLSTGGRYYRAAGPGALETVFRTIDSLEVTERRVKVNTQTEPLYRAFISAGILAVLAYFLIRKAVMAEVLP